MTDLSSLGYVDDGVELTGPKDAVIFRPHSPQQAAALQSKHPITLLATGIQFGKTTVLSLRMKIAMHTFTDPRDNFLITAPTYPIMQQAMLPDFLRIMEGYGTYHAKDSCFKMTGGGTCWIRTGTNPDSVVGIPRVRWVSCDEAGKYSLYFWENIEARAAPMNAPIDLGTSPYTLNWIYKDLIRPKQKDPNARPDVNYIKAKSIDNPYFSKERYELKRQTMDPRRFRAMFGGEWEKMDGLVYDCFEEETNTCTPFSLPAGTKFYAGVDWGTTAPFALVIRAITPEGLHFQVAEVYRTGMTLLDMIQVAKQKAQSYPISMFYCDPSQPGHIKEFNIAGLAAIGANNDIRHGLDLHYDLIKTRRYKLFRGDNKFTLDEYETYHYPELEEKKQDTKIIDNLPVKQDDHAMDANRYVTAMTYTGDYRKEPEIYTPLDEKKKLSIYERADRIHEPIETFDEW